MKPVKPKTEFDIVLDDLGIEFIDENNQLHCFYCKQNLQEKSQTNIYVHMEEDIKENKVCILPVFRYHLEERGFIDVFTRDPLVISIKKGERTKFSRNLANRLEEFIIDELDSAKNLFSTFPKSLKNPNNKIITLYEFNRISQNIVTDYFSNIDKQLFIVNPLKLQFLNLRHVVK